MSLPLPLGEGRGEGLAEHPTTLVSPLSAAIMKTGRE